MKYLRPSQWWELKIPDIYPIHLLYDDSSAPPFHGLCNRTVRTSTTVQCTVLNGIIVVVFLRSGVHRDLIKRVEESDWWQEMLRCTHQSRSASYFSDSPGCRDHISCVLQWSNLHKWTAFQNKPCRDVRAVLHTSVKYIFIFRMDIHMCINSLDSSTSALKLARYFSWAMSTTCLWGSVRAVRRTSLKLKHELTFSSAAPSV